MADYFIPAIVLVGACLAAFALVLGAMSSVRLTRNLDQGLMHHFFYALLLSNSVLILVSTRDFSAAGELLAQQAAINPIAAWPIRLTSLLALAASIDQIARCFRSNAPFATTRKLLLGTALLFWMGNSLLPAYLATHPSPMQLNLFYTPILGAGLLLLSPGAGEKCLVYCRNSIFVFCVVSLLLIVIHPNLVMDYNYAQGFIKGLPRFAGLAPHAVAMGLLVCVGFWLTFYYPFNRAALQRSAQFIYLIALVLSQAKGAWLTFLLTAPVLILSRHRLLSFNEASRPQYRQLAALAIGALTLLCIATLGYLANADLGHKLQRFFLSSEGSQILTFTGRDQIWEVALHEWQNSPIFGYGLSLFDFGYRVQVGMLFATHGHNQFIDTLGRTGLVGTITLTAYTAMLIWMSIKHARDSKGLSVVLILALCFRMVSEVPLSQINISIESLTHYVLLVVLAMCISTRPSADRSPTR